MKKIKIIIFLTLLSTFLLLINVSVNVDLDDEKLKDNYPGDSLILSQLNLVFNNYALEKEWIRLDYNSDSTRIKYSVSVPREINILSMILDIENYINSINATFEVKELKKFFDTNIVFSKNDKVYSITLKKNEDIKRDISYLCFLLDDFDFLDKEELENLLITRFSFTALLTPSSRSTKILERLRTNKKSYAILLNDLVDDDFFSIEPDMSKGIIESKIKSIVNTYSDADNYFIDKSSKLYNSIIIDFVFNVFNKNKKRLNILNIQNTLKGENIEDVKSRFKFYKKNLKPNNKELFIINAIDFRKLLKSNTDIWKKGNVLITLSEYYNPD